MTSFPGSPRLTRGGIVLIDPATARIQRAIALQYNPDTLTRTLQVQGAGAEGGERSEALRLKGPPVETIKLEAEFDATDALEKPNESAANANVSRYGLLPQLAALETIIYPPSPQLLANDALAARGAFEALPVETPLTLFIWSRNRVVPVRLTEFSVTEEAFDTSLNPIRARISLGMRVLSVNDLGFRHRGGALYLLYQQAKERMAERQAGAELSALGVTNVPGVGG